MSKVKKLAKKELKQLQEIELEMMHEFHKICQKHKLKYVLAGGSCLGAVRHNGFIPWDDDIDVHMPRSDYNKFLEIQKKELNKEKYYFQSIETHDKFSVPFAKMKRKDSLYYDDKNNLDKDEQGIFIDIFALDNISDSNFTMKYYLAKCTFLRILYSKKVGTPPISHDFKKNMVLKIVSFFSAFISTKKCKQSLMKSMTKFNDRDTKRMINYGGRYLSKEIVEKDYIQNRILHKFENYKFYITKDYDAFLTNLYGDYMKLPPKEKRYPEHLVKEIKFPKIN